MEIHNEKKTGFVSIIGRPSSGKSTLINTICGYKISIVSKHPQTTQFIVRGIYNDENSQIIFIDTPGFHHFNSNLNRGLSNLAVRTLSEGDLILYLIDTTREAGDEELDIIEKLKSVEQKVIVVYNKIDIEGENKKNIINSIRKELAPEYEVELSALTGKNLDELIKIIQDNLPLGPLYYPDDYVTDQSIPFRIKEIVREKIFINTKEELPHSTYVEVDDCDVTEKKITCHATIFVERDSQKGIIIGNKGDMIKKIGKEARIELKEIFERNVNLFLKVNVHHKWKKKDNFLRKKFRIE